MSDKVIILVEGRGAINGIEQFIRSLNLNHETVPKIKWVLVKDVIERMLNYEINYFYPISVDVDTILKMLKTSVEVYRQTVEGILSIYSNNTIEIHKAALKLQEDFIVDKKYQLRSDGIIEITLKGYHPSTNYDEILRTAVNEAMATGEKVPIKYLRLLGMWD